MTNKRLGFIGAGRMARALAGGFCQAGLVEAGSVWASDLAPAARSEFAQATPGAKLVEHNKDVVRQCDVVFLAVKPQTVDIVTTDIRSEISAEKLVVSIAAGVQLARLAQQLGTHRLIRVMPNTPCLVGQSASGYCLGKEATDEDRRLVAQLLESVGLAIQFDEDLLDAVTGLSGSGPAFVYLMIEALCDGGIRMGLPPDEALQLAAQTVRGAAEMVLSTGQHPAELIEQVKSPGGTTVAGLQTLEEGRTRIVLMAAVEAATKRSRELGKTEN